MAIKTFNVNEDIYKKFRDSCKKHGLSMSKQIEFFMRSQIEEEPKVRGEYTKRLEKIRKEYLERLERIRKRKFIK